MREHSFEWDRLGRPKSHTISSNEQRPDGSGPEFSRAFTFSHALEPAPSGRLETTVNGPDGQQTVFTADPLGRLASTTRGNLSAVYTYDAASRVTQVLYGNQLRTTYIFDDANRPLQIRHEAPGAAPRYTIDYTWTPNDLVATRVETDHVNSVTAATVFTYDNRNRLRHEVRTHTVGQTQTTMYDLSYTYDQVGNRLTRTDTANPSNVRQTTYFYDADPANRDPQYPTNNNRLLRYEERVNGQLVRTVRYTYYVTGQASNITIKDEAEPLRRRDLALYYARNGGLWLAVWGQWQVQPGAGQPPVVDESAVSGSYAALAAREFRYDTTIGRYMNRSIPTNGSPNPANWSWDAPFEHTDRLGDAPWLDASVTLGEAGAALFAPAQEYLGTAAQRAPAGGAERYLHGDLIGSRVASNDALGDLTQTLGYTAFGEPVTAAGVGYPPAAGTRYQYAGAWNYESGLLELAGADASLPPVTLLHLGARWYQPAVGRFVQRDPIGLRGG